MSKGNMLGPVRKWGLVPSNRYANRLSDYFFTEGRICNFGISGQADKTLLLYDVLFDAAGRIPVLILHNGSTAMRSEVALVWADKFGSAEAEGRWDTHEGGFEPFLMLDRVEITQFLRKMAEAKGFTCNVYFNRIVGAFLKILDKLGCSYSLTGLNYLCSIENNEEFRENVLELDCNESEKIRILADLGLSDEKSQEQMEILRMVVAQFAYEAKRCGWDSRMPVDEIDMMTAVEKNAVLLLDISAARYPLMMIYLAEELRLLDRKEILLLIDDVCLDQSEIAKILREAGPELRFGILGSNILDVIGGKKEEAQQFCDKLDCLVLLRHATGTAAQAVAELAGTHEVERETITKGMGKKAFAFLPDMFNEGKTVAKEDRFRIQPEELVKLPDNRAILLDMRTGEIIYF